MINPVPYLALEGGANEVLLVEAHSNELGSLRHRGVDSRVVERVGLSILGLGLTVLLVVNREVNNPLSRFVILVHI